MSKRLGVPLIIATLLVVLMEIPAMGIDFFEARVKLRPRPPTPVSVESSAGARAKFPTKFASIETLCFNFTFEGDLLDPGDFLMIQNTGETGSFGFLNVGLSPQSTRTICNITPFHDETLGLYLDGKHTFTIVMESGSVTIASLSVTATGFPS
jgi:hypothetical protein